MEQSLDELGIGLHVRDERNAGRPVDIAFLGELIPEQKAAADALLAHETGVLAVATGFGKTVVAAVDDRLAQGEHARSRSPQAVMDQWIARLGAFLDLPDAAIGRIGDGKRKPCGVVDVCTLQSSSATTWWTTSSPITDIWSSTSATISRRPASRR